MRKPRVVKRGGLWYCGWPPKDGGPGLFVWNEFGYNSWRAAINDAYAYWNWRLP